MVGGNELTTQSCAVWLAHPHRRPSKLRPRNRTERWAFGAQCHVNLIVHVSTLAVPEASLKPSTCWHPTCWHSTCWFHSTSFRASRARITLGQTNAPPNSGHPNEGADGVLYRLTGRSPRGSAVAGCHAQSAPTSDPTRGPTRGAHPHGNVAAWLLHKAGPGASPPDPALFSSRCVHRWLPASPPFLLSATKSAQPSPTLDARFPLHKSRSEHLGHLNNLTAQRS